ncbi:LacI family DNA-binding transcriptional regulator [Kineococcus sp. NUM-3379]
MPPPPGTARDTGPATLAAVAAASGVSTATVSRVLNGVGQVAPRTRRRVEDALADAGYVRRGGQPSGGGAWTARPPGHVLHGRLDLVFARLDRMWSLEVVNGVQRVAAAHGLQVALTDASLRREAGGSWVEDVLARRPVGVVIVFGLDDEEERDRLGSAGVPHVVLDPVREPVPAVASVGSTNWQGGRAAAEHLLALGHRRTGVVTGPPGRLPNRARLGGFRSALLAAGVPEDDDSLRPVAQGGLVARGDWRVEGGHAAGRLLLGRPDRPTAVFAGSDLQAMGLYQVAAELGLRIPGDLSVVGYDDLPVAAWMGPPLTTVRQPLLEMGEAAARLVLDLAADHPPPSLRLELATDLVVRASTAPAGGA